jgi:endonuclease/exonuclease/phosphatase family metal-dependent hydrolase
MSPILRIIKPEAQTSGLFFMAISLVLLLTGKVGAQGMRRDTVTVMMYNLLNYGVNSSFCTSTNNSVTAKNAGLMTLFNYARPDILGVCEMSPVSSVNLGLLNNVLNSGGRSGYLRANLMNPSGSEIVSLLYYNSAKLGMSSQAPVATQGRDIAWYRLYHKPVPLNGDTTYLHVAVAHLKAGGTASDVVQRGQEAGALVQFMRANNFRGNLLVMGDLNVSGSSEPAYDSLMNAGSAMNHRLKDPVSRPGSWSGNSSFALWHTQSPRTASNGCATGGGMDDRYDHILVNDWVMGDSARVRYVPASFRIPGNDGNRFNGSVNGTFNASVPVAVANALHEISDHLPVLLKLAIGQGVPSSSGTVEEDLPGEAMQFSISHSAHAALSVLSPRCIQFPVAYADGWCRWEIRDAMGRLTGQGSDWVDGLGRVHFGEPSSIGWFALSVEWRGNAKHGGMNGKVLRGSKGYMQAP